MSDLGAWQQQDDDELLYYPDTWRAQLAWLPTPEEAEEMRRLEALADE